MSFPVRLKGLRTRAELSQRELATLAELNNKHVRLLEREDRDHSKVAATTIGKLSRVLGCTHDHLWSGTEPEPTDEEIAAAVSSARHRLAEKENGSDAA